MVSVSRRESYGLYNYSEISDQVRDDGFGCLCFIESMGPLEEKGEFTIAQQTS